MGAGDSLVVSISCRGEDVTAGGNSWDTLSSIMSLCSYCGLSSASSIIREGVGSPSEVKIVGGQCLSENLFESGGEGILDGIVDILMTLSIFHFTDMLFLCISLAVSKKSSSVMLS